MYHDFQLCTCVISMAFRKNDQGPRRDSNPARGELNDIAQGELRGHVIDMQVVGDNSSDEKYNYCKGVGAPKQ